MTRYCRRIGCVLLAGAFLLGATSAYAAPDATVPCLLLGEIAAMQIDGDSPVVVGGNRGGAGGGTVFAPRTKD